MILVFRESLLPPKLPPLNRRCTKQQNGYPLERRFYWIRRRPELYHRYPCQIAHCGARKRRAPRFRKTDHHHTIQGVYAPPLGHPNSTPVTKSNPRFPVWTGISVSYHRQMVGAKRLKPTDSLMVMILVKTGFSVFQPCQIASDAL
jgi:hypothetical protein